MIEFDLDSAEVFLPDEEKNFLIKYLKPYLKKNNLLKVREMLRDPSYEDELDYSQELQLRYWLLYHLQDDYFKGSDKIFPYEFSEMRGIASMSIPNWVTSIGGGAFWACEDLKNIIIPKSVKTIEEGVFKSCPLEKVVIPDSIDIIPIEAFFNCKHLKSVTIPKGVKRIRNSAFELCNSLKNVSVPQNTTIDNRAFDKHVIIDRY